MSENPLRVPPEEREHFEIWAAGEGYSLQRMSPADSCYPNLVLERYVKETTQAAWKAWQIQYVRFNVVPLSRVA